MVIKLIKYLLLVGALLVQACATSDINQSQQIENSDSVNLEGTNVEIPNRQTSDPILRARILADMLFEASLAFDDNRLLLPAGDNAYDRYREVLSFAPDNQVALKGVEDIVDRYVMMAIQAIEIGQFDDAEDYLDRAVSINPGKENIVEARRVLEIEQSVSREYFPLDPQELAVQSLVIMSQLGSIGELVRNYDATFLITARSDAEARWIYQIMREAVGGYRLRGNITLGTQPAIQINIPQA
ncbi:MAG: hypothetical protein P8J61_00890 [Gammaproteobacteria bacterium]|jgi:hypothetical protein|nr:hypothetical protein [Gammaproteobacteria bacterium]